MPFLVIFKAIWLYFLHIWPIYRLFEIFWLGLDLVSTSWILLVNNSSILMTLMAIFSHFWQFFEFFLLLFCIFGLVLQLSHRCEEINLNSYLMYLLSLALSYISTLFMGMKVLQSTNNDQYKNVCSLPSLHPKIVRESCKNSCHKQSKILA